MLIQTLRKLEYDGLLERRVYPVVPPKAEYSLTPLGHRFLDPIMWLCNWAMAHQDILAEVQTQREQSRGRCPERPRSPRWLSYALPSRSRLVAADLGGAGEEIS
jgi:DNA-binding PadR family transcriptional regulator